MPAERFVAQLNEQIGNEFGAEQQYIAAAAHYDSQAMPQLASFFYRQALEERGHAMMMVQYLLDAGVSPTIPGVAEPKNSFKDLVAPVALALEQEQRVSEQVGSLAQLARDEGDYASEQFMQWFIKEQVEEVSTMSDLLTIVERTRDNPMLAEDYVAREHPGEEGNDPTAPAQAGK